MACPDLSTNILERLAAEELLSINNAIVRFAHAPAPSSSLVITFSTTSPTILCDPATIESCYNRWLAIPVPDETLEGRLRRSLETAKFSPGYPKSFKIRHASHTLFLPLWVLGLWPRLRSLIVCRRSWVTARAWLLRNAGVADERKALAEEMYERLSTLPFDSLVPPFAHFRSSEIPDLICDSWLSDEHINAGCQLLDSHPLRSPHIRVLNTYFFRFLELTFERQSTWAPRRTFELDALISTGTVTSLLIPVYLPSHWVFLLLDISALTYSFVDTLNLAGAEAPADSLALVDRYLSCILGRRVSLSPAPLPFTVGEQHDSHSCGVAILSSMAHFALAGAFPTWSQVTAAAHRLRWALMLSTNSFSSQPIIDLADITDEDPDIDISSDDPPTLTESECIHPESSEDDSDSMSLASDTALSNNLPSNPPSIQPLPTTPPRRLVQTTLPFKAIPRDEWLVQERRRFHERKEEDFDMLERMKLLDARKRNKKRERERKRKRAQRERQKAAKVELGISSERSEPTQSFQILNSDVRAEVSALSRPYSPINIIAARQAMSQGSSRRKSVTEPTKRINWCHPLIWPIINKTALDVGYPWSPKVISDRLKAIDPKTFAAFAPQRISQWRDHAYPEELRWVASHEQNILDGERPSSARQRSGIFCDRPEVADQIEQKLLDLRRAGIPLTPGQIRGLICGMLKHLMPEVFTRPDAFGRTFRCSARWVRQFMSADRGWSVRRATRAAQKLPDDLETVLLHAFLRLACVIRDEVVPACCIVNADQTQVMFNPGDGKTWNPAGVRQVNVLGAEDKRAFTLLVTCAASGTLLPFQAIYTGKSSRSLPRSSAAGFSDATDLGFKFEFSGTNNYWSTLGTMYSWVSDILAPYLRRQIEEHSLPDDQRCILLFDCWSLHKSAAFRTWMKKNFPWIIFLYVPAGCTGLFQPCDVGLQRILKLAIQNAAHADVVDETLSALQDGVSIDQLVNDQTLGTLRDRCVQWIVNGYEAINDVDIVKKAFSLCAVPGTEFNLSYESLTSRAALRELATFSKTNPELYREFTSGGQQAPLDSEEPLGLDDAVEAGDKGCTVREVSAAILNAQTAAEANEPIYVPELESEDESTYQPCAAAARRSSAKLKRSSRRWVNDQSSD